MDLGASVASNEDHAKDVHLITSTMTGAVLSNRDAFKSVALKLPARWQYDRNSIETTVTENGMRLFVRLRATIP